MHAVLKPASAKPKAARRPAPPAPLQNALVEAFGDTVSPRNLHDNGIVLVLNEGVLATFPGLHD